MHDIPTQHVQQRHSATMFTILMVQRRLRQHDIVYYTSQPASLPIRSAEMEWSGMKLNPSNAKHPIMCNNVCATTYMQLCMCNNVCATMFLQQCSCNNVCATTHVQQCMCNNVQHMHCATMYVQQRSNPLTMNRHACMHGWMDAIFNMHVQPCSHAHDAITSVQQR